MRVKVLAIVTVIAGAAKELGVFGAVLQAQSVLIHFLMFLMQFQTSLADDTMDTFVMVADSSGFGHHKSHA